MVIVKWDNWKKSFPYSVFFWDWYAMRLCKYQIFPSHKDNQYFQSGSAAVLNTLHVFRDNNFLQKMVSNKALQNWYIL